MKSEWIENEEQRKKKGAEIAISDMAKTTDVLLADIHSGARSIVDPDSGNFACTFTKFASLLAVLGEKADKQTKAILILTWIIAALTLVLVVLTVALLVHGK